ncbi:hypothetical protein GUJ93_ZPchr0008g12106 [Zizania palustris]|uniref:Uncharacterized protein n=1 Tax=Zizania palustris TaxID=103762 RepID=A0A8J5RD24_ZIZPA|nr:hypothetical protein GUJ93_ZPchr0008g12106 [Zizania palustris]
MVASAIKQGGHNIDKDNDRNMSSKASRHLRRPRGKCYNYGIRGHLTCDCCKTKEKAMWGDVTEEPTLR